jgi:hypothetical protein
MYHLRAFVAAFSEVDFPALSSNRLRAELSEVVLPECIPFSPDTEGHHNGRDQYLSGQVDARHLPKPTVDRVMGKRASEVVLSNSFIVFQFLSISSRIAV